MKKLTSIIIIALFFIRCSSDSSTPQVNTNTSKVLIYDAYSKKIQRINLTTGQLTPVSPAFDAYVNSYKCDELHFTYNQASGCYYALDFNLQPPNSLFNQGRIVKYNKATQTISYIPLSGYTDVRDLSEILILPSGDAYILDYTALPYQAKLEEVDLSTGQISLYTIFTAQMNENISSMTYDPILNSIYFVDEMNHNFCYRNFNDGYNYVWTHNTNNFTNILYVNNFLYTFDVVEKKIFKCQSGQSIWTAFSEEFMPFPSGATYSQKEMNLIYNPEQNELIGFHDRSNRIFRISLQTGTVTILQLPYGDYGSPFIEVN